MRACWKKEKELSSTLHQKELVKYFAGEWHVLRERKSSMSLEKELFKYFPVECQVFRWRKASIYFA